MFNKLYTQNQITRNGQASAVTLSSFLHLLYTKMISIWKNDIFLLPVVVEEVGNSDIVTAEKRGFLMGKIAFYPFKLESEYYSKH